MRFAAALLPVALLISGVLHASPPTIGAAPGSTFDATKIPAAPQAPLQDGFRVPGRIVLLRAAAFDLDEAKATEAIRKLGTEALDRVTAEMLKSLARNTDPVRKHAAGKALVTLGERAALQGHRTFAGGIGEDLYLSAHENSVRSRAYPLFMLLDTERARRHR